jgi:hypothetical protein
MFLKKYFLSLLTIVSFFLSRAQTTDSTAACGLRISLLTCSPGEELYSTFGHSALRVVDSAAGIDIIYNYGTFDFDDPDFYSKFVRGKLLYFVSVDEFNNFLEQYKYEHRGIIEQTLQLSCDSRQRLYAALRNNAREENKYYKYDFVYDNCTTRLRDIVAAQQPVITKNILPYPGVTFRNLIHEYLDKGQKYWSKFGIDILLGSPVDKKVSNEQAMFLPDYLLKGFDSTIVQGRPLVTEKKEILAATPTSRKDVVVTPFLVFLLLFLVLAAGSFFYSKKWRRFFLVADFILFFLAGVLGLLILFMWLGTDHQPCRDNYNLLWALPTDFIVVFFIYSRKSWVRKYFLINALLQLLVLLCWKFLPQEMNNALLPFVALLMLRSFYRSKTG